MTVRTPPIVLRASVAILAVSFAFGHLCMAQATAALLRAQIIYGSEERFLSESDESTRPPGRGPVSFDKVQHVTFGFLFTVGAQYALVDKADLSNKSALPLSIAGAALVGIGKEYYDWRYRPKREFSRTDLLADSIGILLAAGFILI